MICTAFGAGFAIGLLHWYIFYKSAQKLFSQQVFIKRRGKVIKFACFRILVTVSLSTLAIRYFHLPAAALAAGVAVGFNAGRIFFLTNSKRTMRK